MKYGRQVALVSIFAAMHAVLYCVSFDPAWRNFAIYLAPLEGIVLGPQVGFVAALLGSSIGRLIKPDLLWMFGIVAEPLGVLMVALLARAKWKPVALVYAVLLSAYFIHPYGRSLPPWTILDIFVALVLIFPAAKLSKWIYAGDSGKVFLSVALLAFLYSATDSLVRIFMLVPAGLHTLFFDSYETLASVFVGAAMFSYIEDILIVVVSLTIITPVLLRSPILNLLGTKKRVEETKQSARK